MDTKIIVGVVPPGGWHYPQVHSDRPTRVIRGSSLESLVQSVQEYRIANQIELGNPLQDVEAYICAQFPRQCHVTATSTSAPVPPTGKSKTLRERVTNWAANRYARAGNFMLEDSSTAERRAMICERCPKNREWRMGCPPCIQNTESQLVLVRQNRTTQRHRQLLGCDAAGHDNATAVLLPKELLGHASKLPLPSICWMNELFRPTETS